MSEVDKAALQARRLLEMRHCPTSSILQTKPHLVQSRDPRIGSIPQAAHARLFRTIAKMAACPSMNQMPGNRRSIRSLADMSPLRICLHRMDTATPDCLSLRESSKSALLQIAYPHNHHLRLAHPLCTPHRSHSIWWWEQG